MMAGIWARIVTGVGVSSVRVLGSPLESVVVWVTVLSEAMGNWTNVTQLGAEERAEGKEELELELEKEEVEEREVVTGITITGGGMLEEPVEPVGERELGSWLEVLDELVLWLRVEEAFDGDSFGLLSVLVLSLGIGVVVAVAVSDSAMVVTMMELVPSGTALVVIPPGDGVEDVSVENVVGVFVVVNIILDGRRLDVVVDISR